MRSPLEGVPPDAIRDAVVDGWGLTVDDLRYFPEGGGAYHWIAQCGDGQRRFVTVDDLDTKPWLGDASDVVFDGLCAAYAAAAGLRASGCAFVVAPVVDRSGAPAVRLDDRHSVSVFEYVEGEAGRWGRSLPPSELRQVVTLLVDLHQRTSAVHGLTVRGFEVPDRDALERALDDLGNRWDGGPFSEPARRVLAAHAELTVAGFAELDRYAAAFGGAAVDDAVVVTHGEPHPGNLIRTDSGVVLVDWDTVALARPERDLWMLADVDDDDLLATYQQFTGRALEREALGAYRLLWALADVAAFTAQLRGQHRRDADAEKALAALRSIFEGGEPLPYGDVP